MVFESFNTHILPDISANTHIIAVLGISPQAAGLDNDGWFLSDFLHFGTYYKDRQNIKYGITVLIWACL